MQTIPSTKNTKPAAQGKPSPDFPPKTVEGSVSPYQWSNGSEQPLQLTPGHYNTTYTPVPIPYTTVQSGEGIYQVAERLKTDPKFSDALKRKDVRDIVILLQYYNDDIKNSLGTDNTVIKTGDRLDVIANGDTTALRLELMAKGLAGMDDQLYNNVIAALPVIGAIVAGMVAAGIFLGPGAVAALTTVLEVLGLGLTAAQIGYLAAFLVDVLFISDLNEIKWKSEGSKTVIADLIIVLGTWGLGKGAGKISGMVGAALKEKNMAIPATVQSGTEAANGAPQIKRLRHLQEAQKPPRIIQKAQEL